MKPIGACKGHGARDERGASLIEVMVAMVMLTSALLGLAGAAGFTVMSLLCAVAPGLGGHAKRIDDSLRRAAMVTGSV